MIEKETPLSTVQKTTLNRSVEQQQKQTFIGSIKPQKGHTLFEIDTVNNTIEKAVFETTQVLFNTKGNKAKGLNKKVLRREGCVYIPALNKKNAIKHFSRMIDNLNK